MLAKVPYRGWTVTIHGRATTAGYTTTARAFQAAMAELAALHRVIDDVVARFLDENSRADERRDETIR